MPEPIFLPPGHSGTADVRPGHAKQAYDDNKRLFDARVLASAAQEQHPDTDIVRAICRYRDDDALVAKGVTWSTIVVMLREMNPRLTRDEAVTAARDVFQHLALGTHEHDKLATDIVVEALAL